MKNPNKSQSGMSVPTKLWRTGTLVLSISAVLAAFTLTSLFADPACTVPGVLTVQDSGTNDATDMQANHDIINTSVAYPFTSTSAPDTLTFTIKVASLSTLTPGTVYYTSFTIDGAPEAAGNVYGVMMNVDATRAVTFLTYTAGASLTGTVDGSIIASSAYAETGSNYTPVGTITIIARPSQVGVPSGGTHTLTNWNGAVAQTAPGLGTLIFDGMPSTTGTPISTIARGGTAFPVMSNQNCNPGPTPPSDWSLVNSPNRPTPAYNSLPAVACASSSDCWAVGTYIDSNNVFRSLIEHWDGTSWQITPSPNTSATQRNTLQSVTCESAVDCWAVGYYFNSSNRQQTLIQHWDGQTWGIVTSPDTNSNDYDTLAGVSCTAANDCWAIGSVQSTGATSTSVNTLTEHWDGSSWSIVTSANATGAFYNILSNVVCLSASQCWAVGTSKLSSSSSFQTLIESWNGTSWTVVSSPNTSATQDNTLSGVTCASASSCWAVGSVLAGSPATYQTLSEKWDGSAWTIVTSANTAATQNNKLQSVTCNSASDCWAAGYYYVDNNTAPQTLIQHWNGTAWAIVASPDNDATKSNGLLGITCTSSSGCWAVGSYVTGGASVSQTLIERWDGTAWSIVVSANQNLVRNNSLSGVTCTSLSDCWAVGNYNGALTLIEHWDGAAWAIVTSPNVSITIPNLLQAVTCTSASDCWAVGYAYNPTTFVPETLTEHWNGTAWAIVPSPNLGTMEDYLTSVTCNSASDCWAVGYYYEGTTTNGYQTLIEHWDGTAWTVVASPNKMAPSAVPNVLQGVTCASASNCFAVGHFNDKTNDSNGVDQGLIEHWDGSSWSIDTTSPSTGPKDFDDLFSVTCSSASDCWAVGSNFSFNSGLYLTLIERWNGAAWTVVTSPNASYTSPAGPAADNSLQSVTCTSVSNCWAVGSNFFGSNYSETLIERWNGTSWSIDPAPNPSATFDSLQAVTCPSASDCWAVGSYGSGATLVLKYPALPLVPTSVVSRKTHGSISSPFDIDLLPPAPAIEMRRNTASDTSGPNAGHDHEVVFTFGVPVTVGGVTVSGGATATASASGAVVTVDLNNVADVQTLTITLTNVTGDVAAGNVSVLMNVLAGDTNEDKRTNVGDTDQTKSLSGATLDQSSGNFRSDVNLDGRINVGDTNFVKAHSGSSLP